MAAANKPVYTRAPSGVVTGKPIALRLMEEEREKLSDIALSENRSMSAQARIFFLKGLELYLGRKSA